MIFTRLQFSDRYGKMSHNYIGQFVQTILSVNKTRLTLVVGFSPEQAADGRVCSGIFICGTEGTIMFQLKSEVQFDMAHFLYGYNGKCGNIHGHRYRLVASFAAETLQERGQARGMVVDFCEIKAALKSIAEAFDHKLVVEDNDEGKRLVQALADYDVVLVPYRPTAEEMSRDFYHRLQSMGLPVSGVELYETPTNSCVYSE